MVNQVVVYSVIYLCIIIYSIYRLLIYKQIFEYNTNKENTDFFQFILYLVIILITGIIMCAFIEGLIVIFGLEIMIKFGITLLVFLIITGFMYQVYKVW